jgi:hypothetical protein
MKSQVHIRLFQTLCLQQMCVKQRKYCVNIGKTYKVTFGFRRISFVKLLFNYFITSDKYIIWSDRDYMFDNNLPDVVFSVSGFSLPVNRICMFIDESEFAVQMI